MSLKKKPTMAQDTSEDTVKYFDDHIAYFYGRISAAIGALITYHLTENTIFFNIVIGLIAIMIAEIGNIRTYKKVGIPTTTQYHSWQRHYIFLSVGYSLLLGLWGYFCFTISADPFIHLLCVAIVLGNVLSVVVRNFSSDKIITMQILAVAFPMMLGMMKFGDIRSMILAAFFLPLFASVRDMSGRLRELFSSAKAHCEKKERITQQLESALNNMSHGLIMFDSEVKVVIANRKSREILGISVDAACEDQSLLEIAQQVDMDSSQSSNKVHTFAAAIDERERYQGRKRLIDLGGGLHVEVNFKARMTGGMVAVIEDVSERVRAEAKIDQLVRFDELTGLQNRTFFRQQATQMLSRLADKSAAALLFIDLGDFKRVNDTLGHEAGDHLLGVVGERLRAALPINTLLCRSGSDEFVALVPKIKSNDEVAFLADKLVSMVPKGITFGDQPLRISINIGIALYPQNATSLNKLSKQADMALYYSKSIDKNSYSFFKQEFDTRLKQRLQVETDLVNAIEREEFVLHFQPLLNLADGSIKTCEALIRWMHPEKGIITPTEFIPLSEELGLIEKIGEWTLNEACRQCATWPGDISVAVNISTVQFRIGNIVQLVRNALQGSGLDPSRLEVEITETAVLGDMDNASQVLREICDLGVRISLDDFGTGYSSLSYLHKLPLDKVKIDKTFVDDLSNNMRSRTLLAGITSLGNALGLRIVVEGIESKEQFDLLSTGYHVDEVQGFYYSRPLVGDALKEFLDKPVGLPGAMAA